ncbi:MAG: HypC/HybG/HupF family hydrogenase formation chaperone [Ignavibacteriales bacterium]|nr:HypC/HybG/HupF family hydrogenase formation chaperone [Ignavibacteriales bacterium]
MCLAIPGKVLEIDRTVQPAMGKVSFGGIQKQVCLEWVPDVKVGEYVVVHVGFAISAMDGEEALKTLKLFEEMDGAMEELKTPDPEEKALQ